MNYDEGKIKVSTRPVITIGDVPLEQCKQQAIETEILMLIKRVNILRQENAELKDAQ